MRQNCGPEKQPAEDAIRDIRRATRRQLFQLKRKSASSWKGCGGGEHRRALPPRGHRLVDVLWLVERVLGGR